MEEFIAKGRSKYGDKYDYSKVEYTNMHTYTKIICPIHGEFDQTPTSHLHSRTGCKKCGLLLYSKNKTKTTDKFIEEVRAVHGDKYDYSQVNYTNCKIAVRIICPIHGLFSQTPGDHLQGGCKECGVLSSAKIRSKSLENFIEEAKSVHGDKYDYSKVNYVNAKIAVRIICPIHGEFDQIPDGHINGNGCLKCGILTRAKERTKTIEEFIEEAKLVHGDKYDYSKVNYINSITDIVIICSKHGEFNQMPNNHLFGKGCEKCGRQLSADSLRSSTKEFIVKAIKVHGDKYDYSKVNYINSITNIVIICSIHGEFEQMPYVHLYSGCPTCKESKGEKKVVECLIKLKLPFKRQYKNKNCKNKKLLPFDFVVKIKDRKGFLLEYQGEQHYKPTRYGSKTTCPIKRLDSIQRRDRIKKEFCENNNIPLLIIPYWQFDRIEERISDFLKVI